MHNTCVYIYIYTHTYIRINNDIYIYIHRERCVHKYIYIYIHIYTHPLFASQARDGQGLRVIVILSLINQGSYVHAHDYQSYKLSLL